MDPLQVSGHHDDVHTASCCMMQCMLLCFVTWMKYNEISNYLKRNLEARAQILTSESEID